MKSSIPLLMSRGEFMIGSWGALNLYLIFFFPRFAARYQNSRVPSFKLIKGIYNWGYNLLKDCGKWGIVERMRKRNRENERHICSETAFIYFVPLHGVTLIINTKSL